MLVHSMKMTRNIYIFKICYAFHNPGFHFAFAFGNGRDRVLVNTAELVSGGKQVSMQKEYNTLNFNLIEKILANGWHIFNEFSNKYSCGTIVLHRKNLVVAFEVPGSSGFRAVNNY